MLAGRVRQVAADARSVSQIFKAHPVVRQVIEWRSLRGARVGFADCWG